MVLAHWNIFYNDYLFRNKSALLNKIMIFLDKFLTNFNKRKMKMF